MSEESKPPSPAKLKLHIINLVAGVVGAAACFGFVLVAHRIGLQLGDTTQDALILGGAVSAGVSVYGAKQLPGKGQ
jgi:hypothetical protein